MIHEDLVLRFEIAEGKRPEAASLAQALAAFADVLRAAANVVEPESILLVEVVGVKPGSQMFKLALRKANTFLERADKGADDFPLVKKALIALGGLIGGTLIVVGMTNTLTPDPRIPADQMAVFDQMNERMAESVDLQRQSARFWGVTQDEPAFERVQVLRGQDRSIIYQVPRSEFAARSGIWSDESTELVQAVEKRSATWDVIL